MTFKDYVKHYLNPKDMLLFAIVSSVIVILIHMLMSYGAMRKVRKLKGKEKRKEFAEYLERYTESYYELIFSATSILLFTGIYFLIDFNYFHLSEHGYAMWMKYQDFILLGFILVSILLNNVLDHIIIPLRSLDQSQKGTLRMAGMLYMLVIFAYIKFIYLNNNYNTIIVYFLTLVVGRFVYFDASLGDCYRSVKEMMSIAPILLLVLLSTALLALYGFGTEYLLRSNGVVLSVFIAHFYVIIEIFAANVLRKIRQRQSSRKEQDATTGCCGKHSTNHGQ